MSIHSTLENIIGGELDDCERAIKKGDTRRALSELEDAVTKLNDLVSKIRRLEREAKN